MKYIDNIRSMKKSDLRKKHNKQIKRSLCLIVSLTLGLDVFPAIASADINDMPYELGSGETVYQLDYLMDSYKTSSISYKRNSIEYQIELYNSNIANENYYSISAEYSDAVEKAAQLQELKEALIEYRETVDNAEILAEIDSQIESANDQINQYNKNISSYKVSMSEAKLQEKISNFYKDNETLIKQEAENKLTNEFLKKCYSLILLKEKQDYYNEYKEYLNLIYNIENIKYQRGLTKLTDLNQAKLNIIKNNLDIEKNNADYTSTLTYVLTETNSIMNAEIIFPLSTDKKEYNLEETISKFEESNSDLIRYKHLEQCYQDYLYSNYGSYSLYKQIELKIEDYQLQYDGLKADIEAYVSDALVNYNSSFLALELAEQDLEQAMKNFKLLITKKEHKKATELDIYKAKLDIKAAQVSYYKSIYDIIIWEDILDNKLFGYTP